MVSKGRGLYKKSSVIVSTIAITLNCVCGTPCTEREFSVFKPIEIAGPVNMCRSKTEVKFTLPPTSELNEMERATMCKEKLCKEMIAAIDDLEIPRCDVIYMGTNITLQNSLDLFTSECDTSSPTPSTKKLDKRMEYSGAGPTHWCTIGGLIIGMTVMTQLW